MDCQECGFVVQGTSVCPVCGAALPAVILDSRPFDAPPRLPAQRWELTAPESYLLRYGPGRDVRPVSAFKLALMDLIARGALTLKGALVRRRWAPGTRAYMRRDVAGSLRSREL